uniref:POU class 6 homeobox 1 n=1 Tax=Cyprinus carpio TaxID=7962 RepID=A0A8C1VJX7_CYPCA
KMAVCTFNNQIKITINSLPLFNIHPTLAVIVMSGQETIRVLEVEVDTALSSSGADGKVESGGEEAAVQTLDVAEEALLDSPVTTSTTTAVTVEVSEPAVQTEVSKPISVPLAQPQTSVPITVQACPQVLTQDGLASLMTGMLAQQGSLGQPLLIPLSMAGSVGGQGGLAVLTLPTATVATLPGLAAASPAGGLLKLPFAGLQAATVLNSVQTQLQSPAQAVLQPQVSALQPVQTAPATTESVVQKVSEPSASVATLQTAGLSISPAIISAASLGAQPQFISSLTTTPIITSAMSNVAGLTGQLITNAQGQVIGTLPLLVNPASLAGAAQGLQLQTVSPQLLLNAQGQIIATIGNGPTAAVPSAASVLPKASVPLTLTKTSTPGPVGKVAPSKVIIAPQPQMVKSVTSLTGAIACGDMPTVGQLVSKPQSAVNEEEAINLEEIREFAKNFKIRRLSLGLTQTQVGQALTATEGPAYSQSAICRLFSFLSFLCFCLSLLVLTGLIGPLPLHLGCVNCGIKERKK